MSGGEELGAALGDELLVRGDDRLAGTEELEHEASRRLDSAHDLGDDADRGVVADRGRIRGQHTRLGAEVPFLVDVAHERADHLEAMAGGPLDVLRVLDEKPVDRGADRPVPEEADPDDVAELSGQPSPPTPHGA